MLLCIHTRVFVAEPRERLCKKTYVSLCSRNQSALSSLKLLLLRRHSNRLIDLARDWLDIIIEKERGGEKSGQEEVREQQGVVATLTEGKWRWQDSGKVVIELTSVRSRDGKESRKETRPDLIDFQPGTGVLSGSEAVQEVETDRQGKNNLSGESGWSVKNIQFLARERKWQLGRDDSYDNYIQLCGLFNLLNLQTWERQ